MEGKRSVGFRPREEKVGHPYHRSEARFLGTLPKVVPSAWFCPMIRYDLEEQEIELLFGKLHHKLEDEFRYFIRPFLLKPVTRTRKNMSPLKVRNEARHVGDNLSHAGDLQSGIALSDHE